MVKVRSLRVTSVIYLLTGAVPALASPPVFSDQTTAAGLAGAVQSLPEEVILADPDGADTFGALRNFLGGGAVGDFNNDGFQDLLFLSGGIAPDRLYINNGHGTFTDSAAAWGVDRVHIGTGAAVGDVDGDGWLDIYVGSLGPADSYGPGQNLLYRNTAQGGFEEIAVAAGVATTNPVHADTMGSAFGDYDLDGDLDLFVAGYFQIPPDNAYPNRLFRNDSGTFTDVSDITGIASGFSFSFSPRLVDMNDDRFPDILLASDFGVVGGLGLGSRYLTNILEVEIPEIGFFDVTGASGTGLDENGMGHTVADFDNDGKLDWYVTSIFEDGNPDQSGNKLYLADQILGTPPIEFMGFQEVAATAGVDDGGWGWGVAALDVNHDGWVDLVETNGWVNGAEWQNESMYLFVNDSATGIALTFTEMAAASGLDHTGQGRGLLNFDYDNDGDQDIAVFTNDGALRLYRNDLSANDGVGLRIQLESGCDPTVPPHGIGAEVFVSVGATTWKRHVDAGSNFLTQGEISAHFGLGTATAADAVRVRWPGGASTTLTKVDTPNLRISLTGGDTNNDGCVNSNDLAAVLASWGSCPGCPQDLTCDGVVGTPDLETVLTHWGCS